MEVGAALAAVSEFLSYVRSERRVSSIHDVYLGPDIRGIGGGTGPGISLRASGVDRRLGHVGVVKDGFAEDYGPVAERELQAKIAARPGIWQVDRFVEAAAARRRVHQRRDVRARQPESPQRDRRQRVREHRLDL